MTSDKAQAKPSPNVKAQRRKASSKGQESVDSSQESEFS